MVVPDFELICEIMLVAEGFLEARLLARKFITLYSLCKELLSKQVAPLRRLLSLLLLSFIPVFVTFVMAAVLYRIYKDLYNVRCLLIVTQGHSVIVLIEGLHGLRLSIR